MNILNVTKCNIVCDKLQYNGCDVLVCYNEYDIIKEYNPVMFVMTCAHLLTVRDCICGYYIIENNGRIIGIRKDYGYNFHGICDNIGRYIIDNIYEEFIIKKLFNECIKGNKKDNNLVKNVFNNLQKYDIKFEFKKVLGEYSASEYIYSDDKKYLDKCNYTTNKKFNNCITLRRDVFDKYFVINVCYGRWSDNGQRMIVTDSNDILIVYNSCYDKRGINIPKYLQKKNIVLMYWSYEKLSKYINKKYNKGFIICNSIKGVYDNVCIVKAFDIDYFIDSIKSLLITLNMKDDVGQFKVKMSFWESIILS